MAKMNAQPPMAALCKATKLPNAPIGMRAPLHIIRALECRFHILEKKTIVHFPPELKVPPIEIPYSLEKEEQEVKRMMALDYKAPKEPTGHEKIDGPDFFWG